LQSGLPRKIRPKYSQILLAWKSSRPLSVYRHQRESEQRGCKLALRSTFRTREETQQKKKQKKRRFLS
ncbi:hypothetical protein T12_2553, partial [Trichinella patagoniensis]